MPPTDFDARPPPATAGDHRLMCSVCGRVERCSPAERLRYTRLGWPRCCGEVMCLLVAPDAPPGDTALDDTAPHPVPAAFTRLNP